MRPRHCCLPGAIAASGALALVLTATATATAIRPAASTIAGSAVLGAGGRIVHLRGTIRCHACTRFTLGATVSQGKTGAVGQGGVRCVCTNNDEHWLVAARTREATRFRAGGARVCVWIIARGAGGTAIDARQWCEDVTLRSAVTT
jgi:hypothetical protein